MREVVVHEAGGLHRVLAGEQLRSTLRLRHNGANHFTIAAGPEDLPMLDLLVRGTDAVLHYFPVDGSIAQQSLALASGRDPRQVAFIDQAGQEVLVPGSAVIDVAAATRCVEQFVVDLARPSSIDWFEL